MILGIDRPLDARDAVGTASREHETSLAARVRSTTRSFETFETSTQRHGERLPFSPLHRDRVADGMAPNKLLSAV